VGLANAKLHRNQKPITCKSPSNNEQRIGIHEDELPTVGRINHEKRRKAGRKDHSLKKGPVLQLLPQRRLDIDNLPRHTHTHTRAVKGVVLDRGAIIWILHNPRVYSVEDRQMYDRD